MKKKIHIKSALLWNVNLNVISQIITLGMSITLARILMPEDFGIMAIGMILVNYVNTFTDFGFTNALIQKDNITKDHINSVFSINFIISCLLTVICFLGAPFVSIIFDSKNAEPVIKALSCIFILTSFTSIYEASFKRELKYKFISIVNILTSIITYTTGITLAFMGFNFWALVISHIVGVALKVIIYISWCKWIPWLVYSHSNMKYIYNFGMWNFFRSQLYFINRYFLHIIIAANLNTTLLGVFDKSYEISRKPSSIFGKKINGVMLAGFSRLQGDQKGLHNWFFNLLVIQIVFFLPIHLGIYAISPYFIMSLLGEKWALAIDPLKILSISFFFMTCSGGYASFNIGVGNYKAQTLRSMLVSVLMISFSVPFTIIGGVTGACYAICIVSFIGLILSFFIIKKKIYLDFLLISKQLFLYLTSNVLLLAIVSFFSQIFVTKNFTNLIIIIVIGILSYSTLIITANVIYGKPLFFPIISDN